MSLHILNKLQEKQLKQCIENCSERDVIVLIEAAADKLRTIDSTLPVPSCSVFLLTKRGSKTNQDNLQSSDSTKDWDVTEIDQEEFVQLTTLHNPLVSW